MTKRDGGSAFPLAAREGVPNTMGMSQRKYFAGQALIGLLTTLKVNPAHRATELAFDAYVIADAMLAEGEREREE